MITGIISQPSLGGLVVTSLPKFGGPRVLKMADYFYEEPERQKMISSTQENQTISINDNGAALSGMQG